MSAAGSFPVVEYLDHRGRVGADRQLWENGGWSVRGRDGDTDYLYWASPYLVQGIDGASYRPGRFAVDQTLLITAPADSPDELRDNDFVAVGWDARDHLDWEDVRVTGTADDVTWRMRDRTYAVAADRYAVDGVHAGIRSSLTMTLDAPPLWFTDPAEGLDVRANRWWIASGEARGIVDGPQGRLEVRGAHAVHERHIHLGLVHDPVRLLAGGGVCWFTAGGDDFRLALLARPSLGSAWAQIVLGERTWDLTDDALSIETVRTWVDPQTSMVVAQSWVLGIRLPGWGTVEVALQARARAYYTWDFLAEGQTMLYWWLCSGEATIRPDDGVARHIGSLAAEAHLNRTFSRRHDGSRS